MQPAKTTKGILPIALTPQKTLLIGAGSVAKQKYEVLCDAGFSVSIMANEVKNSFFESLEIHFIALNPTVCNMGFLEEFDLVIDASGDNVLGEFLFHNRKKYAYLLNVVDTPEFCDFYFGAVVRRENVAVMVSSNGASPLLAQSVRDKIANLLPKAIGTFARFLQQTRTKPLDTDTKEQIKIACKERLGKVFIIGCGPGDFSNLTLKAYEAFSLIDVALIDNLVSPSIWKFLEELGVECISVGKQKGKKSFKQEDINALMLQFAKEGKCVGRLKGGDPVVFGRVWEEGSFLKAHGVETLCISGVSSSLCGALSSGIIPTLRGVSSGVLIVSAHLRENIFHTEWLHWLKDSPYTLIVMMAYSFAKEIVAEAQKLQIDLSLEVAFISKVGYREQKSVIGTLEQLELMAEICDKPAILVIGKAVKNSLEMPYVGKRVLLEKH